MSFASVRTLCFAILGLGLAPVAAQDEGGETIVSHGYSDFGELKYGPDFEHLDYVNPDAPKGGEISVWAQGTFDSMNPYSMKGRPGSLSSSMFESLMTAVADDAYGSYCLLCETLEYPESKEWVIFTIHPDAAFADGTPVTAEDVVFTVDLLLEQAFPSYRLAVSQLYESVEALDERRVKFTFAEDQPRKGLISQAGATPVFSKTWYEESGARLDESRLETGPGSAPYQLESYDVNQRIVYARDPDYWGADLPINVGRNNFDRIRVEYFADANSALEAFKAGAYTFRQETSSLTWATAYDFPAIEKGWVIKAELPDGTLPAAAGFVFNLRRDKFQDPRVREALGLMFNFTWTNETLQYGLFEQRASFWENSDLAATGVPEGKELELLQELGDKVDPAILTEPVVSPHESGDRQLDRGNLRRASSLLEEAGWIVGDDGMRRKDGQTLQVEILEESPNFDRIINPYVQNLRQLGVDVTYNRVDPAQYTNRERAQDFDIIYDFYRTGLEEGLGLGQRFSTEEGDDAVFNPAGYRSEAVDSLIEAVIDAETVEDMKAGVRAIDRVLRHDRFVVPTWYNDSYWVAYYDMYRYPEPLPPYSLGHLDFWWYDAEAAERLREVGALR